MAPTPRLEALRRRRHSVLWVLATIFLSSAVAAQTADSSPRKPSWKLSLPERLAERLNPEAIKARAAAESAQQREWNKRFPDNKAFAAEKAETERAGGELYDSVSGRRNPELFLPSELFDDLLLRGFSPGRDRRETRLLIEERAAALGFGRALWARLEKAATSYLALQHERDRHAREKLLLPASDESTMSAEALHWCRVRAEALANAKADFGEEPLLRLLYLAVAPDHNRTYVVKDLAEHSRHLQYLEGGCR